MIMVIMIIKVIIIMIMVIMIIKVVIIINEDQNTKSFLRDNCHVKFFIYLVKYV